MVLGSPVKGHLTYYKGRDPQAENHCPNTTLMTPPCWVTKLRPTEVMECPLWDVASPQESTLRCSQRVSQPLPLHKGLLTTTALVSTPFPTLELTAHYPRPKSKLLQQQWITSGSQKTKKSLPSHVLHVQPSYPTTCSTCSPLDRMR